jgi:hypothetical protein
VRKKNPLTTNPPAGGKGKKHKGHKGRSDRRGNLRASTEVTPL